MRSRRSVRLSFAALLALVLAWPVPASRAEDLDARAFLGSWGPAGSGQGRVFRHEGESEWTELSPPGGLGDAVWDQAYVDGKLWVGTHEGAPASEPDGITIAPSERSHGHVGRIFRFDGTTWEDMSPDGGFGSAVTTVNQVQGRIYITVDRDGLYRWEGGRDWTLLSAFLMGGRAIVSDAQDGREVLYIGQEDTDEFWFFDPEGLISCGDLENDSVSDKPRDLCQVPSGPVCSADCWFGSCIHAMAEFEGPEGRLVHAGTFGRQMYRWDPDSHLFVRIDSVPAVAGDPQQTVHVQGLAPFEARLWVGTSLGRIWSTGDATESTYVIEEELGTDTPVSVMGVDDADSLLWVASGGVPYRWARTAGAAGTYTFDGSAWRSRGLDDAGFSGAIALLVAEPEVECDAGPDQRVECTGASTEVLLDGSGSKPSSPVLGMDTEYAWTGPFIEGTARGLRPTVHFAGPGDHVVTLTVTSGAASASCEVVVRVVDSAPPTLAAADGCLWPPNHRHRCLSVEELTADGLPTASDSCDGAVPVRIVAVSSSQPEDEIGRGDGATLDDILFDDTTVCVRGERQGADPAGRGYFVTLEATDSSGQTVQAIALLHVPHDQRARVCPDRPVDPGLLPGATLPLGPGVREGTYPPASRPPRP